MVQERFCKLSIIQFMNTHSSVCLFLRLLLGIILASVHHLLFYDELSRKMDVSLIDFIQNMSDADSEISTSSSMLAYPN